MDRSESAFNAVSPVVAVILVVAITVTLSATVGMFVLQTGESTEKAANGGVTVSGNTISLVDAGNVDRVYVQDGNGSVIGNISSVGDSITVTDSDSSYTVIGVVDGQETVLTQVPASEVPPVADPGVLYSEEPDDTSALLSEMDGSGSESDPYVITNVHELQAMDADRTAHYRLGSDIDASGTESWNTNSPAKGFEPVGNDSNPFEGSLNGAGHSISSLYINRTSERYVGLFGQTDGADIGGVALVDANVTGDRYVGALLGNSQGGTSVDNVTVSGAVTGGYDTGGLIGRQRGSLHRVQATNLTVDAERYVGGLVGYLRWGSITESSASSSVSVEGTSIQVGGLVGMHSGSMEDSYSLASVHGDDDVGGLVGENFRGSIATSYAAGPVSASDNDYVGGLVGHNGLADTTDSYWDASATGRAESQGGYGLYTDEMQGETDEQAFLTFDFENTWAAQSGDYPRLQYQTESAIEENTLDCAADANSYTISTVSDLQCVRADPGANYTLSNDIDASSVDNLVPLGASDGSGFNGTFDGAGHTITGLTVDRPDVDDAALFGRTESAATVANVNVTGATITGYNNVSLVVATNAGTISNVSADGDVTANKIAGALVGTNDGLVEDSKSAGSVKTTDDNAGGLVGHNDNGGDVNTSTAVGSTVDGYHRVGGAIGRNEGSAHRLSAESVTVTGERKVGGLLGYHYTGSVTESYATGSVESNGIEAGGLVGMMNSAEVRDTHARTDVTGEDHVGGLVGQQLDGTISTSYATGTISASDDDYIGGIVGQYNYGTVNDTYWDAESTGQSSSGNENSTALTTSEMTGDAASTNMSELDFTDTWVTVDGDYPELK